MSTIGFRHARIPDSQIDIGPKILLEANADCMVPSPPWAMMGHVFAVDDRFDYDYFGTTTGSPPSIYDKSHTSHAILTEDSFIVVVAGHSAAAGQGILHTTSATSTGTRLGSIGSKWPWKPSFFFLSSSFPPNRALLPYSTTMASMVRFVVKIPSHRGTISLPRRRRKLIQGYISIFKLGIKVQQQGRQWCDRASLIGTSPSPPSTW
jgi:hypothetical protein